MPGVLFEGILKSDRAAPPSQIFRIVYFLALSGHQKKKVPNRPLMKRFGSDIGDGER